MSRSPRPAWPDRPARRRASARPWPRASQALRARARARARASGPGTARARTRRGVEMRSSWFDTNSIRGELRSAGSVCPRAGRAASAAILARHAWRARTLFPRVPAAAQGLDVRLLDLLLGREQIGRAHV